MELSKQLVLVSTVAALFCINPCLVLAKENKDFSYNLDAWNGPQYWGEICKDWETCKIGHMQSPIAIYDKVVIPVHQPEYLQWTYCPKDAVMKNMGHNIVIEWKDAAGAVWINGIEYQLKQMHWHTPSENTINGHRFSLEVHLFHQRPNDEKMAMVSILYKVGHPDPFFTKVEKQIHSISRKLNATVDLGIVDPTELKKDINRYYRFNGSTTTPPCVEGVTWTISRKVRTISMEQLNMLKYAVMPEYATNARPLQQLNDRVVKLFG